jgi:protein-tyrosine phosphatase
MGITQYIKDRFGSKRGLLNALKCATKLHFGRYRKYQGVSLVGTKRFIFICSGNICRSPLAEYQAKLKGANAISFGLHCRGGDSADPRAIGFAQKMGINLEIHKTQNIKDYKPQVGDLLVGMEPKHTQELEALLGNTVPITLAGLWLTKAQAYIHDPYNTNEEYFDFCEAQVVSAVAALVEKQKCCHSNFN